MIQPVSLGIRTSHTARFAVVVEGAGPFVYQWYKDSFLIPGATTDTLVIANLRDSNKGTYTVKVSNAWVTVESEPAELQVMLWRTVQGIYQDVVELQTPTMGEALFPGRININLNNYGLFSGTFAYAGSSFRFSGRFGPQLVIDRVFLRRGKSPLNLRLQLDTGAQTITVLASHTEPLGTVVSTAILRKHFHHPIANPAPQKGRYTVVLDPGTGTAGVPESLGFLTGSVSAGGSAVFVGRLPSGQAVTSSNLVQATGRVPFYRALRHSNRTFAGQVGGRLVFDLSGVTPVIAATLSWQHVPKTGSTFMPDAFAAPVDATGSAYLAPRSLQPVLSLPLNASMFALSIVGPSPATTMDRWLRLTPRNVFLIDPTTDAKIKLTLSSRTGRVTGSFIDVATGSRRSMEGVVLQAQGQIGGRFRVGDLLGSFTVVPRLQ